MFTQDSPIPKEYSSRGLLPSSATRFEVIRLPGDSPGSDLRCRTICVSSAPRHGTRAAKVRTRTADKDHGLRMLLLPPPRDFVIQWISLFVAAQGSICKEKQKYVWWLIRGIRVVFYHFSNFERDPRTSFTWAFTTSTFHAQRIWWQSILCHQLSMRQWGWDRSSTFRGFESKKLGSLL